MVINIHEAKTHFSKLIQRVLKGEEITIANAGRPVAKLVPVTRSDGRRTPGSAVGQVTIGADFDASLPKDFEKHFE